MSEPPSISETSMVLDACSVIYADEDLVQNSLELKFAQFVVCTEWQSKRGCCESPVCILDDTCKWSSYRNYRYLSISIDIYRYLSIYYIHLLYLG